jgi:hypothetical protein
MILGHSNGANYLVSVAGLIIVLGGLYGWALEPSAEPEIGDGHDDHEPVLVGVGAATTAGALGSGSATETTPGAIGSGDGDSGGGASGAGDGATGQTESDT